MTHLAPVFDGMFDTNDPADAVRFLRMIEELKVKVTLNNLEQGLLLHRWVDATHIHVLVFDDTIEGRGEAQRLLADGYEPGVGLVAPKVDLSDLVEKVKQNSRPS